MGYEMKPGAFSTCHRRGYKLVDIHVWQVTKGTPAVHDYYWNTKTEERCDPPRYTINSDKPETNILPPSAVVLDGDVPVVESKLSANDDQAIKDVIDSILKERNELRSQVEELEKHSKGPSVDLVTRFRLTVRWTNGYQSEDEWGFESVEEAQARYDAWVNTFGEKFEPADICAYQINIEGDKVWGQE